MDEEILVLFENVGQGYLHHKWSEDGFITCIAVI